MRVIWKTNDLAVRACQSLNFVRFLVLIFALFQLRQRSALAAALRQGGHGLRTLCNLAKFRKILNFDKILRFENGFSWPVFPGLDQDLFPPMVFLVFWDSIPRRCKGVHCVDLGESFPTSIHLQMLASIQPRTSPKKFESSSSRVFEFKL